MNDVSESTPGETTTYAQSNEFPALASGHDSDFELNVFHFHLLYHARSAAAPLLSSVKELAHVEICVNVALKYSLSAPYLLQEILAFTAFRLGDLHADQQGFYKHQASGLQTRALSLFNSVRASVDDDNCIPIFLFAGLLGLHVLGDTLLKREGGYEAFLDRFASYMKLHRGVRSVTDQSWETLLQSELKPILEQSHQEGIAGQECVLLYKLLDSIATEDPIYDACADATKHLQWSFDQGRLAMISEGTMSYVQSSWAMLVKPGFSGLVMQREPVALIILAYYAVLLHQHRSYWLIGSGGKYLVESVAQHLDEKWDEWMAWPKKAIQETSDLP